MPKVFIIIATWNSARHLSDLFLSLNDIDYPRHAWQLVVVDNGSRDKTLEILGKWQAKMHNFASLIRNDQNLGFAPANNQGIRYALEHGAEYIALLNDDTLVESDWLIKIVKTLEQNQQIGLAQPLITRYPEVDKINTFGNQYQFTGFGYSFGEGQPLSKFSLADWQPSYLSYAAVVIRAKLIQHIGLLDENYFSYHEDTDHSFRARLAGWDLLVVHDSVVHHNYRPPIAKNKIRYFWLEKNRLYLLLKFFKLKTLILIFPAWLFMEFGLILYSLVRGFFFQRLRAYGWILLNLPKIFMARRHLQKSRQVGDDKLFEFIVGRIDFQEVNNFLLTYLANPALSLYLKLIKKFI